jgi:hypothetical protein
MFMVSNSNNIYLIRVIYINKVPDLHYPPMIYGRWTNRMLNSNLNLNNNRNNNLFLRLSRKRMEVGEDRKWIWLQYCIIFNRNGGGGRGIGMNGRLRGRKCGWVLGRDVVKVERGVVLLLCHYAPGLALPSPIFNMIQGWHPGSYSSPRGATPVSREPESRFVEACQDAGIRASAGKVSLTLDELNLS